MINNIGPEKEIVDLAHPMTSDMPNFDSAPPFKMIPYIRLGDLELPDGYWGCNELLTMSGHSGTHLDALGHVAQNGRVFGGKSVDEAQDGTEGLVLNSIETVEPIVGRGILFDIAALKGDKCLPPQFEVGADLLAEVCERAEIEVQEGDSALIRTGWESKWGTPEAYIGLATGTPGVNLEGAQWLGDRGVRVIGADTATVEFTSPDELRLPVHMETLVNRGVFLLENASLSELAAMGATEFLFLCAPLKMKGASGSPVRPVAVVSK